MNMKKNLRNLALAFVCFISAQTAFAFNDRPITPDQLPQAAQQVLSKHFSGIKIKIAKYESLERSYDVVLENGVTLDEAIRMFTVEAAYASYEENERGTLGVGKYCDMVVLDKNLYEIDPDEIKDAVYYEPLDRGYESNITSRLARIRGLLRGLFPGRPLSGGAPLRLRDALTVHARRSHRARDIRGGHTRRHIVRFACRRGILRRLLPLLFQGENRHAFLRSLVLAAHAHGCALRILILRFCSGRCAPALRRAGYAA